MHLAPSDEQRAVQEAARRFLAAEVTRERRLAWDATAEGYDAALWRDVARLGWFGWGVPEADGGQGASFVDVALLVEECGRAVVPFAVLNQIGMGIALAALATPAQRAAWLPRLARGEAQVGLAVAETDAVANPAAFRTTIARRGAALRLDGEKRWVAQGGTADASRWSSCPRRRPGSA